MIKNLIQSLLRSQGYELRSTLRFGQSLWGDVRTLLERRGVEPAVAFDVGAHYGETFSAIRGAFPKACVHCFEPDPDSFGILKRNVEDRGSVALWHFALGSAPGTARFHRNKESMTNSLLPTAAAALDGHYRDLVVTESTIEVPVRTLDDVCAENGITKIDILKTDCQGYDLSVLKGGQKFLSERRAAVVICEMIFDSEYDGQGSYHDLCAFLDSKGYRLAGFYNMDRGADLGCTYCDTVFVAPEIPGRG